MDNGTIPVGAVGDRAKIAGMTGIREVRERIDYARVPELMLDSSTWALTSQRRKVFNSL
jgi:hypothetical protein